MTGTGVKISAVVPLYEVEAYLPELAEGNHEPRSTRR